MSNALDSTESLLLRTKKLLRTRGEDLTLRELSEKTNVGYEWLRSLTYRAGGNPGIVPLERVHNFLTEYHAARRFQQRKERGQCDVSA